MRGLAAAVRGSMAVAARDAPVGGQAVIEGVMMRGVSTWAVAMRATDGSIKTHVEAFSSWLSRHRVLRVPLVRGVAALVESLKMGFRALSLSANEQLPEDERGEKTQVSAGVWGVSMAISFAIGIGLFFVVPVVITDTFKDSLGSPVLFGFIEGLIRVAILLAYLGIVTRLESLRRVFEYHGAEHRTIACFEAGLDLVPSNAQRFSRFHIRCGTSFILIVMIVAIFVFAIVGTPPLPWLIGSRILGVPVIVGVSYEIIRLAGRYRKHRWVTVAMTPGLQLQRLTTRVPDDSQCEVAIAALQAVLEREDPHAARDEDRMGMEVVA